MELNIRTMVDQIDAQNRDIDEQYLDDQKRLIDREVRKNCGDIDKMYEKKNGEKVAESNKKAVKGVKKNKVKTKHKRRVMTPEEVKAFFEELKAQARAREQKEKAEQEARLQAEKAAAAMKAAQEVKREAEKAAEEKKEEIVQKKPVLAKAVVSRKSIEKAQTNLLSSFKKELGISNDDNKTQTVKRGIVLRHRRSTGRDDI